MPAISVCHLRKTFTSRAPSQNLWQYLFRPERRETEALGNLSFSIEPGERVAFVGPNGAGKSTTIKILTGILFPSSGEVRVAGFTPWKERRRLGYKIGTVFGQRSQLWYHLPAGDTFDLLARIYDLKPTEYKSRRAELSKLFAIEPLLERPVRQLSLGERMRCEIVASLLHRPSILFLDEPTIGLDVTAKAVIRDLINDRSRNEGTTVLLTSHDTGDMEQVCDRALVINSGRLLLDKPVSQLRLDFIRRKLVTLMTAEPEVRLTLPGVKIVSATPHRTVLEIDTSVIAVDKVVDAAMKASPLRDLNVEDPPMEEIIKEIYKSAPVPGDKSAPVRAQICAEGNVSKYLAFARIAFLQETAYRGALLGRALFYVIILLVFSHIWKALATGGAFPASRASSMLWYLAFTEWIIMSAPLVHLEIERDVRSGDIAYHLCRPVSYLTMRIAEGFGAFLFRLLVMGLTGFTFTWLYTGQLPEHPLGLLYAAPLAVVAGMVYAVFLASIGISAFWLQDSTPLAWVWQKLSFIFGGLIFPLSIYPDWLRTFTAYTPFYFLLYGPAESAVHADTSLALRSLGGLIFWGFVALSLLRFLYMKGQSQLQVNGG